MTIDAYLAALASHEPTPGGGSAATIAGAMAAALIAMVARITSQNSAYGERSAEALSIVRDADRLRDSFLAARVADEAAYGAVVSAMALPNAAPAEKELRRTAVQRALAGAAAAPLDAAGLALETVGLAHRAQALGNIHLQSDVDCAFVFARASLVASALNVRINHAYLKDASLIEAQEMRLRDIEAAAAR